MQRVVASTRAGQHSRLLSLLQPWAAENASIRWFGTSDSKVGRERITVHDSPEIHDSLWLCMRTRPIKAAFWTADINSEAAGLILLST